MFKTKTMTSGVKQYVISEPIPKKGLFGARLKVFVLCFLIWILIRIPFDRSVFARTYDSGHVGDWVNLLLLPTIFSVCFAWRFPTFFHKEGLLIISDDFVERLAIIGSQSIRTRINRAQVKSVSEISRERFGIVRDGIVVKQRGRFGSWLRGYVFVPSSVEDYEAIKAKLLSWTPSSGQHS